MFAYIWVYCVLMFLTIDLAVTMRTCGFKCTDVKICMTQKGMLALYVDAEYV